MAMRALWWLPPIGILGCAVQDKDNTPCPSGYKALRPGVCIPSTEEDPVVSDTGGESDTGTAEPDDTPSLGFQASVPRPGVLLPSVCSTPTGLPADPITDRGVMDSAADGGPPVKMVDLAADPARALVWGVGEGGLLAIDVQDASVPIRLSTLASTEEARYDHVFAFQEEDDGHGLVYLTEGETGLIVVDGTDPVNPEWVGTQGGLGLGHMSQWGDRLYVANQSGIIQVMDISNRSNPAPAGAVEALGTPWRLAATESALYLADSLDGLVTMDRTDPDNPMVMDTISIPGIQDVAVSEQLLVAAAGVHGAILFDLTLPLQPRRIGQIQYGSAVLRVHLDGDTLWLVDHESVRVIDVTEPLKAQPVGSRATPQWATDVVTVDQVAWVADWGALSGHQADPATLAPDIELQLDEVYLHPDGQYLSMTVRNMGRTTLELTGIQTDVDQLDIRVSKSLIGPRGTERLRLSWPGGEFGASELCISSNDPDTPVIRLPLHSGGGGSSPLVGSEAPDFILTAIDIEGSSGGGPVPATFSERLVEQRGQPMVLVFFSMDDPLVTAELLEIEHNIWRKYEPAGVGVWGISAGDPPAMASLWITLGLSFDLFPDPDRDVQDTYPMDLAFSNAEYPQEWVIDAYGNVIYAGNVLNPGALQATIERALE